MQYSLWLLSDIPGPNSQFKKLLSTLTNHLTILSDINDTVFTAPVCRLEVTAKLELMALKEAIQSLVNDAGFDCLLKPAAEADITPKLLIMDMDSTLVQAETIDQIAKHAGVMSEVSAITESAMRGELDFTQSLLKRVSMLNGIAEAELTEVHNALPLTTGAETLIHGANAHDCYTVLVSGGFTYFAQPIADRIGIQEVHANTLEFADGRLTGRVTGAIVDAAYKKNTLERLLVERGIKRQETIAIGDGANDLLMLGAAGTGIAFHGKPKVQAESKVALNLFGLDALNWWQGW